MIRSAKDMKKFEIAASDGQIGDIGSRLRQARERRGLSLHDTARQTKLSISVLQAIERNDFASLPDGLYRRAYVRILATEFGLDANELAADYRASYEPPIESPVEAGRHRAIADRWLQQLNSPRRSIVTLAALLAVTAAWFWIRPDSFQPSVRLYDDTGESVLVPTIQYAQGDLAVDHLPGAVSRVAAVDRRSQVPLRIELAVTAWCWVAAESDGERALYRLVKPGERVVLEGQRLISLRLGNAGSVTLSINDGPRRSAGDDGEVVELMLTPDNVEALRNGPLETVSGE
jgi:transcriptional regulator with XRE-family HTH domain